MLRCWDKSNILQTSLNTSLRNEIFEFRVVGQVNLFLSFFHLENSWLNKFFAKLWVLAFWFGRVNWKEIFKRQVNSIFQNMLSFIDLNVVRDWTISCDWDRGLNSNQLFEQGIVLVLYQCDFDFRWISDSILNDDSVFVLIFSPLYLNWFQLVFRA